MHTTRPSKQFIIRGSIAIVSIVIILLVQTDWFRSLFNKKPIAKIAQTGTVGQAIGKDSNGNGIPDWEEKLWGLDPTVIYTNGTSNKEIIETKKKVLGITNNGTPTNETDQLARDLFIISASIGQSDSIDPTASKNIAQSLATNVKIPDIALKYTINTIKTVPTNSTSLQTYFKNFSTVTSKYDLEKTDVESLVAEIEQGNTSRLSELADTASEYIAYSKQLSSIAVPIAIAQHHLDLTNSLWMMAQSLHYISQLEENSTQAIGGMAIYSAYSQHLTEATLAVQNYLSKYGILQTQ